MTFTVILLTNKPRSNHNLLGWGYRQAELPLRQ